MNVLFLFKTEQRDFYIHKLVINRNPTLESYSSTCFGLHVLQLSKLVDVNGENKYSSNCSKESNSSRWEHNSCNWKHSLFDDFNA